MRGGVRPPRHPMDRTLARPGPGNGTFRKCQNLAGLRPGRLQPLPRWIFPAASGAERQARIDDNRRAIDEAAVLGAGCLVLVCGPAPDRDIDGARGMVADGIAALVEHAGKRGVRLGIEPLHPMFAADRSVIVTLAHALDLARSFDSEFVGVVLDVFHLWWDPQLYGLLQQAAGSIVGFHISDWASPLPGILAGRSMMGDGVIELRRIRTAGRRGLPGPDRGRDHERKHLEPPAGFDSQ